jgi:hypothetical protein
MKTHLEQRFAAEREAYHALKEATESRVMRWRYSKGRLWTFNPVQLDILTTEEVANPEEAEFAYGYDAEGWVVCVRQMGSLPAWREVSGRREYYRVRRTYNEQFIRHQPGTMEVSEYETRPVDSPTRLGCVYQVHSESNRIVEVGRFWKNKGSDGPERQGFDREQYFWEGDRLKKDRSFDENGNIEFETEWEPDGTHKLYRVLKDGSRYWTDEPAPKGATVKSLVQFVRQRLLEVIPQRVKAAGLKDPAYCLVLAYDAEGEDILGPMLGIGAESERQKWLREKGDQAWLSIWNPAEFTKFADSPIEPDDEELERKMGWLNKLLLEREVTAPAIQLLVEVAAELEKLDWSAFLPTTPDFVVYAVDLELMDLRKNLKKIVAPRKLAALKAAKCI